MNCPEGLLVDHIDGNKIDNRKSNLRICNKSQNTMNQVNKVKDGKLVGVNYQKYNGKMCWIPRLMINYKNLWLGSYDNKEDAIVARLKAEKKYCGEFAPQKFLFEQYNI